MSPFAPAASVRAAVLLLSISGFLGGCALRICDGLIPRFASDFGKTPGAAGGVVLAFSVAYGLAQLLFGPLGDRYGKARMICVAVFGCAGSALACTLATSFDQLLLLRGLWGISAAGLVPLSIAWIGDAVPYEQRQATLAKLLFGGLTGMAVGQAAGGWFGDAALGWRGAFGTLAAGFLVVGIVLLMRVRTMPSPPVSAAAREVGFMRQMTSILSGPWARVVLLCVLVEGIFLLGPMAFLPSYLHHRFGLRLSTAATLVSAYAVGGVVYTLMAVHLVRRLGERRMVACGGAIIGAGFVGWYLMPFPFAAAPIALAAGFGTYLFHNTVQTNATQMAPHARGSAMACFAFCLFTGQAIGVSLAGFAFDHGGAAPLLLVPAAVLPVLGWYFSRALKRRP